MAQLTWKYDINGFAPDDPILTTNYFIMLKFKRVMSNHFHCENEVSFFLSTLPWILPC